MGEASPRAPPRGAELDAIATAVELGIARAHALARDTNAVGIAAALALADPVAAIGIADATARWDRVGCRRGALHCGIPRPLAGRERVPAARVRAAGRRGTCGEERSETERKPEHGGRECSNEGGPRDRLLGRACCPIAVGASSA